MKQAGNPNLTGRGWGFGEWGILYSSREVDEDEHDDLTMERSLVQATHTHHLFVAAAHSLLSGLAQHPARSSRPGHIFFFFFDSRGRAYVALKKMPTRVIGESASNSIISFGELMKKCKQRTNKVHQVFQSLTIMKSVMDK